MNALSGAFNELGGYYDKGNRELAFALVDWDLLDEKVRLDPRIVASYMKWSFTSSFLQLINAWQWFCAGITLSRNAYLPAQETQMNYYAIFFAYGSLLAAHFKGHYTLKINIQENPNYDEIKTRREVWVNEEGEEYSIQVKPKGKGGEHEVRAKWFYEVFKDWGYREDHPAVVLFENDRLFHTGFRNMFTYSLADMGEELFSVPDPYIGHPDDEVLDRLWQRDGELVDYYPEEFWALEHLKAALDIHVRLMESFGDGSPYGNAQYALVENLLKHHERTGLSLLITKAMQPIIERIGLT